MLYKKNLYISFIIQFFTSFSMVDTISTLFFQKNGVSLTKIGLILATYQITKFILEIPTGLIADKIGRKFSIFLGVISFEVYLLISIFFKNFIGFNISVIFQATSYAFISGALEAFQVNNILSMGEKHKLTYYNSISRAIFFIAQGLGSILGGYMAYYNYEQVYISTIIMQILPIICVLLIKEPHRKIIKEKKESIKMSITNISNFLLSNSIIIYFLLIDIIISLPMIPIVAYLPNYLKSRNFTETQIGLVVCIQLVLSAFTGLFSNKIMNKFSNKNIIQKLPYLCILCVIIFAILKNPIVSIAFYVLRSIILSLHGPVKFKYLHIAINEKYRASIISTGTMFMALLAVFTEPLLGYTIQCIGYNLSFIITLLISIILLLLNNLKFNNKLTIVLKNN
jgi:MFS family permease